MSSISRIAALSLGGLLSLGVSQQALACACGCNVFDVGTSSMMPTDAGGMAYIGYDYMNQNQNWAGSASAPAANNGDKRILTSFITAGVQYMFNRQWGVQAEVPAWNRSFTTDNNYPNSPRDVQTYQHFALGDIRLKAIYTGLSADMSTGLTFGVKLPTGDSRYANFDPDTEIGTGSTDLLPGFYQRGRLTQQFNWFVNGQAQVPVISKSTYHPGAEADLAVGVHTNSFDFGGLGMITPQLELIGSWRASDGGSLANPSDSGYRRLLVAPGFEYDVGRIMATADVEFPVVVNTTGNQLTAFPLLKFTVGYMF
jgi:hypothetical protein